MSPSSSSQQQPIQRVGGDEEVVCYTFGPHSSTNLIRVDIDILNHYCIFFFFFLFD
jgi:hypothetical protein